MNKDLVAGIGCFIVAFVLFLVAVNYLNLPIVYEDVATGKCVKVVNADGSAGDCKNLPEKYIHEYSYNEAKN